MQIKKKLARCWYCETLVYHDCLTMPSPSRGSLSYGSWRLSRAHHRSFSSSSWVATVGRFLICERRRFRGNGRCFPASLVDLRGFAFWNGVGIIKPFFFDLRSSEIWGMICKNWLCFEIKEFRVAFFLFFWNRLCWVRF